MTGVEMSHTWRNLSNGVRDGVGQSHLSVTVQRGGLVPLRSHCRESLALVKSRVALSPASPWQWPFRSTGEAYFREQMRRDCPAVGMCSESKGVFQTKL